MTDERQPRGPSSFALATTEEILAPVDLLLGDLFASVGNLACATQQNASAFAGVTKSDALSVLLDVRRFALLRLTAARFLGCAGCDLGRLAVDALQQDLVQDVNLCFRIILDELDVSVLHVSLQQPSDLPLGEGLVGAIRSEIDDHILKCFEQNTHFAGDPEPEHPPTNERGDGGRTVIGIHEHSSFKKDEGDGE